METTKLTQKVDFTGYNIFAGIDVHKKDWNVSIFLGDQYVRSFTQPVSPVVLIKFLQREYPGANYLCAYESGFSGFWIQREFSGKGIPCYVLDPGSIPRTVKQKLTKRDPVDSRKIAETLSSNKAIPIFVPDIESEYDRGLVRYRSRLSVDLNRCKNRIRSFLYQFGIEVPPKFERSWSKLFINWLKEIDQLEGFSKITLDRMIEEMILVRDLFLKINKDVRELSKKSKYTQRMQLLLSIPGIGPLTAITFITETIDIKRFPSFKDFNSFVGLYPMEHSSGDDEHKGSIMIRHNKYLRKLIIESSWVAIRLDPALTMAYNKFLLRKTGKRAIVKIARKLLSRVMFVLMNEKPYIRSMVK